MLVHQSRYVQCPVVILRIDESKVMGDTVADALRDEFLSIYEQSGAIHAVIDMEKVHYLSSAGFRPLLALNKKVREREGRLVLCRLSEEVERAFVATRLISSSRSLPATFETHADVPTAVASLYHKPA